MPESNIGAAVAQAANTARLSLLERVPNATYENHEIGAQQLRTAKVMPEEFGPAFAKLHATNPVQARHFAVCFSNAMDSNEQLAKLFAAVAQAPADHRRAVLDAHKESQNGITVVHSVGLVPAAHGQVLMQDFLNPDGKIDDNACKDVGEWLTQIGAVMRQSGLPIPNPEAPHDFSLGGLISDIGHAASSAFAGVT